MTEYRSFEREFEYNRYTTSPNLGDLIEFLREVDVGLPVHTIDQVWATEWDGGRIRVGVKVEIE